MDIDTIARAAYEGLRSLATISGNNKTFSWNDLPNTDKDKYRNKVKGMVDGTYKETDSVEDRMCKSMVLSFQKKL